MFLAQYSTMHPLTYPNKNNEIEKSLTYPNKNNEIDKSLNFLHMLQMLISHL